MNAEKTYQICCDILNGYAAETNQKVDELLKLMEYGPNPYSSVQTGLYYLMQDARERMDKAVTPASQLAALKRIVKNVSDHKESLKGYWLDGEGRVCVCDGYRAARLRGIKCDSIPKVEGWDGLDKVMEKPAGDLLDVTMPSLADCKAYIAQRGKGSDRPMFVESANKWFDPVFMADMLQTFPDATWTTADNKYGPLWCESAQGDGILMPHRPPVE